MGRLALVVAVVLLLGPVLGRHTAAGTAVVGAAVAGIVLAWGSPAIAAAATHRQVRVLDAAAPHAGRVHRLMALQQVIASASSVSEVAELRRAALVGHRFLWDGAGLVLAAGEEGCGLGVVVEYEAAYQRLAVAAAHALEKQGRLEGRLADLDEAARAGGGPHETYCGTRPARLVEEAVPAVILDEITESLNELAAGLRHAQHAVTRAADPAARLEEKHHGDRTTASAAGRSRGPLAAQRARLASSSAARGLMWAVLTVSLLGTIVTAPYLPSPWGQPVLLLSIVGGIVSGLVTVYHLLIAFMAALGLLHFAASPSARAHSESRSGKTVSQERA